MGRYITVKQLLEAEACERQLRLFTLRFGRRVYVTETRAAEHAQEFSWFWAAGNLLSGRGYRRWYRGFELAHAEYLAELRQMPSDGSEATIEGSAASLLRRDQRLARSFAKMYLAGKPKRAATTTAKKRR